LPEEVVYLYSVAICEDEAAFRDEQESICCGIFEKLNIEYHISIFSSSENFWDVFMTGKRYDLILLDILMDETNGMELAKRIREHDGNAAIVFITSNPGFALHGYDVNALHYLLKPLESEVLERLIKADYQLRFQNNFLGFKSGTQTFRLPIRDVIYLETVGRRVAVTMPGKSVEYPGKLSDLIDGKEQFIRCHKAFAINPRNIRELTKTDAIAINGIKIPVSRTYIKDVQKALLRQMRDG